MGKSETRAVLVGSGYVGGRSQLAGAAPGGRETGAGRGAGTVRFFTPLPVSSRVVTMVLISSNDGGVRCPRVSQNMVIASV